MPAADVGRIKITNAAVHDRDEFEVESSLFRVLFASNKSNNILATVFL